ncbi:helix-turn-helix domain-containing protein [Schleiferia thermophila]|uniref:Transcriptional regulator with XRE-family HTH domain n=1 Tax=Schleiferia thermophila TaxID=884107 RepID=A0A368ZVF9_9FLAO|nr:helix-turn-helix transcriptional regulator [Schleiferia thermophila]RCX00992.1 transcriptional regulator with XRE-family HTH domain [Schleiferia thermophila]GCD80919.1 hypothetical protein JCM30197_21660 [Schleiferia thermophila]
METISNRITQIRKQKGLTQNELAERVGISKAQMSRYVAKGVNPPANVLAKMADELGVSMDFLLHGNTDDKAASSLSHAEVIQQYKEVDQLPAEERNTVIRVVSALLRDYKTRQAYAS